MERSCTWNGLEGQNDVGLITFVEQVKDCLHDFASSRLHRKEEATINHSSRRAVLGLCGLGAMESERGGACRLIEEKQPGFFKGIFGFGRH